MERKGVKSVNDLDIYTLSYSLALEVFILSKHFPKEELYSLTDQIRRSSRSIAANISEGFAKRQYQNVFRFHLISAIGSSEETITWIDFARDFSYLSKEDSARIKGKYHELGAMIFVMIQKWRNF